MTPIIWTLVIFFVGWGLSWLGDKFSILAVVLIIVLTVCVFEIFIDEKDLPYNSYSEEW